MTRNNNIKNNIVKNIIFWILIIGGMLLLFNGVNNVNKLSKNINYSTFIYKLNNNEISFVDIDNRTIKGKTVKGESFITYVPLLDSSLIHKFENNNIIVKARAPEKPNIFLAFLINWLPMLLIFGFFIYMIIKAGGGSKGGPFSIGKSRAKLLGENEIKITLDDVAGIDEAKEEVKEIVDFLREPSKYEKIGGKIPKGILMVGPPGTGKTLLARAIAGEAKVPFFSISGSDFVEMFVGVGASRVRDMFEQAKKKSPCLVFIDEIDAVGRHRGSGMGGGNDEREQTLNQMLVEMDGFTDNEGVIVIAATNRPDVLDKALLRPGRFDRQVVVGLPAVKGREEILKVHMKKIILSEDVHVDWIARGTPGFSGAELANLVNEAALSAARESKSKVFMVDFEKAKDKILMGSERRSMAMTEKEKKLTAYHEAGHTIIGQLMPEHDPVYKVSIIPRGRALGVTMYMPERDTFTQSRIVLLGKLCSIFGGRIAEEIIFGYDHVTTGASNDIQVATDIARNYVARWGLSDAMGAILYDIEDDGPFRNNPNKSIKLSDSTIRELDTEVRKLIAISYDKAKKLLEKNIDILHNMADALIKYETIDAIQVDDLMARRQVRDSTYQ